MSTVHVRFAGDDDEEALLAELLAEARETDPENGLASKFEAGMHLYYGRHEEALASLRRAAATLHWDFEVHYFTGLLHYLLGNAEEALDAFRRTRSREIEMLTSRYWGPAYLHTARIHTQNARPGKQRLVAQQFLDTKRPNGATDGRYVAARARMLALAGDAEQAAKIADQFLEDCAWPTYSHQHNVARALAFAASGLPDNRSRMLAIGAVDPGYTLIGRPAPAIEAVTAQGDDFILAEQRGKVVLLTFWYPHGRDFLDVHPRRVDAIRRRHEDAGLVVVGMNPTEGFAHGHLGETIGITNIPNSEPIRDDYHASGRVAVVIDREGVVRDWQRMQDDDSHWEVETRVVEALREPVPVAAGR